MATAVSSRWDVSDVAPKIGSAIRTDKDTLLSGERARKKKQTAENAERAEKWLLRGLSALRG